MTLYAAAVPRDYLRLDRDYGVTFGGTDSQADAVQAAMDDAAASHRTIFVGGPTCVGDTELQWPTANGHWGILGAGFSDWSNGGPACFFWTGDPGYRKFGIRVAMTAPPPRIEKMGLIQIGGVAADWGELSTQALAAIMLPTGGHIADVAIRGWAAGAGIVNDHHEFYNCDIRGNGRPFDFLDNPGGGLGDLRFERCFIINAGQANIALASNNAIANALWTQGHGGNAPFGVWRYQALTPAAGASGQNVLTGVRGDWYTPLVGMTVNGPQTSAGVDSTSPIPAGTTITNVAGTLGNWTLTLSQNLNGTVTQVEIARRPQGAVGCRFTQQSFEYCGNALIYDEVGGASWRVIFDGDGEFGTGGGPKWPGKPSPMANIYADSIEVEWIGTGVAPQTGEPLQPYMSAKDASVKMDDSRYVFEAALTGHKSFVFRSGGGGADYSNCHLGPRTPGSSGLSLGLRRASEAIIKGDLLERDGSTKIRKSRGGMTCRPVGFALMNYDTDDVVVHVTGGDRAGSYCRSHGAQIDQGKQVVADPVNPGCVVAWDGTNGVPVGQATVAPIVAAGGTFTANTTNGSDTLTNVSSLTNVYAGAGLSGTGVQSDSAVISTTAAPNTVKMTKAATANATGITVTLGIVVGQVDVWVP